MGLDITGMNIENNKKYIGSCCGNKFIILDCSDYQLSKKDKSDFAKENIVKNEVDSALFFTKNKDSSFFLEIFEKDGSESESCGNGLMLISYLLGLGKEMIVMKNGSTVAESSPDKQILSMDVRTSHIEEIGEENKCLFVKMGEPHMVYFVDDVNKFDLAEIGKKMQKNYPEGVNVDAVEKVDEFHYLIRTYERGVFAETESCGTGSLSSYIAISHLHDKIYTEPIEFKSKGGIHFVSKNKNVIKLETLKKFCEISVL